MTLGHHILLLVSVLTVLPIIILHHHIVLLVYLLHNYNDIRPSHTPTSQCTYCATYNDNTASHCADNLLSVLLIMTLHYHIVLLVYLLPVYCVLRGD